MNKLKLQSTKENLKSHQWDKKTKPKSFYNKIIKGSLVATFVAATPFLFYLYEFVPDTPEWHTIFGTYKSNYYGSANVGIWVIMMKLLPLILSLTWFFTCKHWWYHALLVPITMFSIQIISALNNEIIFMDEIGILFLLPIMGLVIPSIYLIRAKMFNKINDRDKSMEELEAEFMVSPKTFWDTLKQYF